ncbi:hypothetical protein HK104_011364 [Borealophlyctis nickersoniae]|nr:hypothetical protein HK104_011364 [Borealophlyctis nickersoniae]
MATQQPYEVPEFAIGGPPKQQAYRPQETYQQPPGGAQYAQGSYATEGSSAGLLPRLLAPLTFFAMILSVAATGVPSWMSFNTVLDGGDLYAFTVGLYKICAAIRGFSECTSVGEVASDEPTLQKIVGASAMMPIALFATLIAVVLFVMLFKVVKRPFALGGAIAILVSLPVTNPFLTAVSVAIGVPVICQIIAIVLVAVASSDLGAVRDKKFGAGFYLAIIGALFHIVPLVLAVIVAVVKR